MTFQDPRKGAGGRRPKALNPATEPFRAKGTAVAKPYVLLVLRCRPFKPFPSKLVYSRFPPGSGRLQPDPFFLEWRCFLAFATWQSRRHRRCTFQPPETLFSTPINPRCRTLGPPMTHLGRPDATPWARRSQDPRHAAVSSLRNTRVGLGGRIGGACPS